MKTLLIVLAAILSITTSYGVNIKTGERGNRKIKSKEISISDYSILEATGSADIYYEQKPNKKPYLRIEIDENLMQYVKAYVSNKTLYVGKTGRNINPTRFRIFTNSKSLVKAGLSGSGDLILKGRVQADRFELYLQGSGDVVAESLSSKHVTAKLQGSGDLVLKGQTNYLSAMVMGSGDLDARKLAGANADCKMQGSGDLYVNVKGTLNAAVRGSGDIIYSGSPRQVNKTVRGSGTVSKH